MHNEQEITPTSAHTYAFFLCVVSSFEICWQSGLLDQWTQFLITDSLIPANQISTDDFAGSLANQTNLAIKGIVGIRAMAEIASLLGDKAKSDNYTVWNHPYPTFCFLTIVFDFQSIAESYVTQWQTLAASDSSEHLTLSVGFKFQRVRITDNGTNFSIH